MLVLIGPFNRWKTEPYSGLNHKPKRSHFKSVDFSTQVIIMQANV